MSLDWPAEGEAPLSIYKACEIYGRADGELTPDLFRRWGRGLARQLEPQAKFIVGGDVRRSTPALLDALAQGLIESGVNVVDLGILPTPLIDYARRRLRAAGAAAVTGGHGPAEFNGLQWMLGDLPAGEDEVALLRQAAEGPARKSRRAPGTRRPLEISFDYVAWLQETWVDAMGLECRVVLDPMFGCCARRARRYLQAVFPRALFSAIHDSPEDDFGGQPPDCSQPERLKDLVSAVHHEGADLGMAFDGDGGRVTFVDGQGVPLTAEEAAATILHSLEGELRGQTFVHDLKLSGQLVELARQRGAKPVAERCGRAFVGTRMRREQAFFGAESGGRCFFRALDGGADGLFTACWMLSWLQHCGRPLDELRRQCPPTYLTPDLTVPLTSVQQLALEERVAAKWPQRQTLGDDLRIELDGGWAVMHDSPREPGATFRFEADNWAALQRLVHGFCEELDEVGDVLWVQYAAAVGDGGDGGCCRR